MIIFINGSSSSSSRSFSACVPLCIQSFSFSLLISSFSLFLCALFLRVLSFAWVADDRLAVCLSSMRKKREHIQLITSPLNFNMDQKRRKKKQILTSEFRSTYSFVSNAKSLFSLNVSTTFSIYLEEHNNGWVIDGLVAQMNLPTGVNRIQ